MRAVIEEVQPLHVMVEQPRQPNGNSSLEDSGSGSSSSSETPSWIQAFLDHFDTAICEENLSTALPSAGLNSLDQPPLRDLRSRLAACGAPDARVGRDVLDPDEHFGLYAHNELARFPERILDAWQMLGDYGYLPGEWVG